MYSVQYSNSAVTSSSAVKCKSLPLGFAHPHAPNILPCWCPLVPVSETVNWTGLLVITGSWWSSEAAMGSCLSCPEKQSIPDNHQTKFKVGLCWCSVYRNNIEFVDINWCYKVLHWMFWFLNVVLGCLYGYFMWTVTIRILHILFFSGSISHVWVINMMSI